MFWEGYDKEGAEGESFGTDALKYQHIYFSPIWK